MKSVEKNFPLKRPLASRADLWFWAAVLLLNGLLSLPTLLFLAPENRISFNIEMTLGLLIWVTFAIRWSKNGRRWFWGIFLLLTYLGLIYKSYAAVLLGVYQMQPNFYNDLPFIANGLPFLLSSLNMPKSYYLAFVVVLLALFIFLGYFTYSLFVKRAEKIGRFTQMLMVSLGVVFFLYGGAHLKMDAELPTGVDSLVAEIRQNVRAARASRQNIDSFLAQNPYTTYDYAEYDLVEKPNIYFIFFESYGSVLYKRDHFYPAYEEMASTFETRLMDAG